MGRGLRGITLASVMLLSTLPTGVAQAGFYKCVVDGRTVYQATPCTAGSGGAVELAPINSLGDGERPGGAAQAGKRAPAAEQLPASPPGRKAVEPLPVLPGWHVGASGYEAALAEGDRTGKPVLVYFYTNWCPHCRHFSTRVLPDAAVTQQLAGYVKVQIDAEAGAAESALFKRLGGKGIPYVLMRKPGGQPARINTGREPRAFVAVLQRGG